MRRRYLPLAMAIVMSASLLNGCTSTTTNTANTNTTVNSSSNSNVIYGEVSEVSDDEIKIEVGTMKEMSSEKPEDTKTNSDANNTDDSSQAADSSEAKNADSDNNQANTNDANAKSDNSTTATSGENADANSDAASNESTDAKSSSNASSSDDKKQENPQNQGGEAPSMLDKSGEEQTITVSSDTKITKQSMGGPGQGGEAPGNAPSGEAPQKPSDGGNNANSDTPPQKPSEDAKSGDSSKSDAAKSDDSSASDTDSNKADETSDSNQTTEQSSDNNSGSNDGKGNSNNVGNNASNENSVSSKNNASNENSDALEKDANDSSQKEKEEISLSDISEGDIVSVTLDDDGSAEEITVVMSANQEPGGGGGDQSQAPDSYDANTEYTKDTTEEKKEVSSDGTDENAIHASNGAKVSLSNFNITRNSSESQGGDSSSFYGVGATVLESDGTLYLKDSTITSDSKGAAGIFAYGDGTVYTANTKIKTTKDTSGGIHAAGGGTLYAWDMDVETSGESSAAIRSDRGGGTMVVDGGTYTSNGTGSPAIYSTANIAVNNAKLTANGSEAVCIEGLNSLRLFNSNLTGNMSDNKQNDCTWNVILYQSMSGDSEVGNSTFEMNGGSLTAKNGGMFYTTNTESTFVLSNIDITYADENDFFLKCTGNSNQRGWGTSGQNGADCNFTAINQEMEGDIIWDSISKLDLYMTKNSSLTGAVTDDESNAGDGGDGYCNLYIEKGSVWTVTGDSTVTNLQNAGTITDKDGKTVTIKGTDGTVYVEGDSNYTVTVTSYKDSADVSGASTATQWSDYEVERPSELSE